MLYANCVPVKGILRSVVCDLQMGTFKFIPNDLYDILILSRINSIGTIKSIYKNKYDRIIDEYFGFLIDSNFGEIRNKLDENFSNLSLLWDEPAKITNAIFDRNNNSDYEFKEIFKEIEKLGCKDIQLRFFDNINFDFLIKTLELLQFSKIKSIELIIKFSNQEKKRVLKLCETFPRIKVVIVHSADRNEVVLSKRKNNMGGFIYMKESLISEQQCGLIHKNYLRTNLSIFTESQNHNTCLNRKISIDVNGEIKNCPSMQKSYGNIKDTTLEEALNKQGFKDLWNIKKDDIKVCQDCEFRHICTDCRAYIDNPNDVYSHPSKCTYNPYLAKWVGEDGYIPVLALSLKDIEEAKNRN